MKKFFLCSGLLLAAAIVGINAQNNLADKMKYNRSSLSTWMVYNPADTFVNELRTAFSDIPCPDKYDDHNIDMESRFLSAEDLKLKTVWGAVLSTKAQEENRDSLLAYLNRNNVAKTLVAKWFGFYKNNQQKFDVDLLVERGNYNASELDIAKVRNTVRGEGLLADAGEELIGNTYILINDIQYVSKEEQMELAKLILQTAGGAVDLVLNMLSGDNSNATEDMMKTLMKFIEPYVGGFKVRTYSYLYRLQWNDSIANIFYDKYYTETGDPEKIAAFLADSTTFRMEPAAYQYEYAAKSKLKGSYDQKELIKLVTTRSLDNNIASLQKQYEDFKVKAPIISVELDKKGKVASVTAQIGEKEGIDKKSKFQVLQMEIDDKGRTKYKKVGTLKISGKVWDNRYGAASEKESGSELTATTFKVTSGTNFYPGMLIIEGQYRKAVE